MFKLKQQKTAKSLLLTLTLTALAACSGGGGGGGGNDTPSNDPQAANASCSDGSNSGSALPASSSLHAWVGKDDSKITFNTDLPANTYLYGFGNADCKVSNITACANKSTQNNVTKGTAFTSASLTASRGALYCLKNGGKYSYNSALDVRGIAHRSGHQLIEFKGKLWLIGGQILEPSSNGKFVGTFSNDVFVSDDGASWKKIIPKGDVFSPRKHHELVVFKDKLWLIGGQGKTDEFADVYSSDDGISWKKETDNAAFSKRHGHQVVAYKQRLWLFGGNNRTTGNFKSYYVSDDGVKWTFQSELVASYNFLQATVYKGSIYITGGKTSAAENEVIRITEATRLSTGTSTSYTSNMRHRSGHQALVFDDKLILIGGETNTANTYRNDVMYLPNTAILAQWAALKDDANFPKMRYHQAVVFKNKLLLIGGETHVTKMSTSWQSSDGKNWTPIEPKNSLIAHRSAQIVEGANKTLFMLGLTTEGKRSNAVYKSTDGINWSKVTVRTPFSARDGHRAAYFANKLWVIGGRNQAGTGLNDVWYSSDNGVNWTKTTNPSAHFAARLDHAVAVLNNKMYLHGGRASDNRTHYSDLWVTTDGTTWTNTGRNTGYDGFFDHQLVAHNNKLWLIGGALHNSTQVVERDDVRTYTPPTSGLTGGNWSTLTLTKTYGKRQGHQAFSYNNKLWVVGGMLTRAYRNDVLSSSDGKEWTAEYAVSNDSFFVGRAQHQAFAFNNKLWMIGGIRGHSWPTTHFLLGDIWQSDDGATWRKSVKGELNAPK